MINKQDLYMYRALCTNVVDGDTADFIIDLGFRITTEQRVRFVGINAPELHTKDENERKMAELAKSFVEEHLLGRKVYVRTYRTDSFGRYLGEIYFDNGREIIYFNDWLLHQLHFVQSY